jgi:NAD+ synthase (glutamine-hydrolysing)
MAQLRIGLAQVDSTVGDLPGNADVVSQLDRAGRRAGLPPGGLPGDGADRLPAEDLVLRSAFVQASLDGFEALAVRLATRAPVDVAVVVGYCGRSRDPGAGPRPAGRRAAEQRRRPARRPGRRPLRQAPPAELRRLRRVPLLRRGDRLPGRPAARRRRGPVVCEDMWQPGGPLQVARAAGAGLVVCINGSPYERGKDDVRGPLASRRAVEAGAAVVYVNCVGGQDELVFDGDSLVVDADGELVARAPLWEEGLMVVDLDLPAATSWLTGAQDAGDGTTMTVERVELSSEPLPEYVPLVPGVAVPLDEHAEVWGALVTATRDYVEKNRFRSVVLGLSGGIDSALVATIACDALGPERVHVVGHAERVELGPLGHRRRGAGPRQGLHWSVIPIAPMVDAWLASVPLTGLSVENLQARVRGTTLMALSNEHGHLVLTTGNKSEAATGFSTLYGDSAGGFAPDQGRPEAAGLRAGPLAQRRRGRAGRGAADPGGTISKPPSAELAPGQLDSDRLPPVRGARPAAGRLRRAGRGRGELGRRGRRSGGVDRVIALVDAPEYKRRQSRPARRSPAGPSGATGGCRSPPAGGRRRHRRRRAGDGPAGAGIAASVRQPCFVVPDPVRRRPGT